jgi:tetratricopeptide (TPR) repeat protein
MRLRLNICAVIALTFLETGADAAEAWLKLSTPNFELYTTAGEKKGREAILYFEQVRSFFMEASGSKRLSEFPVRIVAFRGEKQYQPYRINDFAIAYYSQGRRGDYIVMQDISTDHYPVAVHEYTHLVVHHSGLKLPPWLNEGLAELYSTLKPEGSKAEVGDIIPGRARTLLTNPWIGLDVITTVDHQSPLYNERDRAAMFYAESWALTHILFFAPGYREKFGKFLTEVSSAKSTDDACQAAFGKHLWEVESELRSYLKSGKFYRAVFDVKLEKSAENPDVAEAQEFDSSLILADLLAVTHKYQEAFKAYEQIEKSYPNTPEVEESLGYLAWQADDKETARESFERALAAGTRNPRVYYDFAMLSRSGPDAAQKAAPAFQKALELKPDYVEARLEYGMMLVNMRKYGDALAQLRQIKAVDANQAQWYYPALATAYLNTGDTAKARECADAAKKWAKTPQQMERAESLLRALETRRTAARAAQGSDQAPVIQRREREAFQVIEQTPGNNPFVAKDDQISHVEGVAQRLDCLGRSARFHVLVGKTAMVFEIPDPERVQIKHTGEEKHDFVCGVQKPYKVAVDYAVSPDAKKGTVGVIRTLEF